MRVRFGLVLAVASLTSLASMACGGAKQKGAEAPESDPWAGYQGTFAGPSTGPSRTASTAPGKTGTKAKDAEATKAEPAPEPAAEPAKAAPPAKKSVKKPKSPAK